MKLFKISQLKQLLSNTLSLFLRKSAITTSTLSTISFQENNERLEASIERIVDGDTLKVKLKHCDKSVTLRLLLIDTPELLKFGAQQYSLDALNFTKEVLKVGDSVYIEYDGEDKTDKYNRHLCYLWFYSQEDNTWKMFNEKIVEKGLARVGYIYSQKRYLDALYIAQDKAKTEKINIWSIDGYVTNSGFNAKAYNNSR